MEGPQWLFVTTTLTLVFLAFGASPMYAAIQEAIDNSEKLNARSVVSAINTLATAPDGTTYRFDIPSRKCTIKITENFVEFSKDEKAEILGIIKTSTQIAGGTFDCSATRTLVMRKDGGVLTIQGG